MPAWRNEAQASGFLLSDNSVDLRDCGVWGNPVNCAALRQVERRFGDGDGVYSPTEVDRAFNAYYDAFWGEWAFYGPGRTIRVGVELEF